MKLYQALALMALASPTIAVADDVEYRLNIGLFTEHYLGRGSELNEKNQLVQVSAEKNGNVGVLASFVNSHFTQSYLVGIGREVMLIDDLRIGGYAAVVKGYEGHLETHFKGLMAAPIVKLDAYGFTLNILPAVYVLGYEFEF
tara:strand:- start:28406 stop:28834 length:429 start_codon:yes stop_codon:yes gene_type:complete